MFARRRLAEHPAGSRPRPAAVDPDIALYLEEPRVEPRPLRPLIARPPGPFEGLLGEIVRLRRIAAERQPEAAQARDQRAQGLPEGV